MRNPELQAEYDKVLTRALKDTLEKRCAECDKPFLTGKYTRRRSDAIYCKSACRQKAHRKFMKEYWGDDHNP